MGSKSPPKHKPWPTEHEDDAFSDQDAPSKDVAARHLVGRIASALQIPEATLYNLPDAAAPVRQASFTGKGSVDLDRQCDALLRAFRSIDNPEMRRRLLSLVQAAAGTE